MRYETISLLKASEKCQIFLVRGENDQLLVQRYQDIDRQLLKKLSKIESPYVAKILCFGEDDDGFFTIEEYIDGTPASELAFTEAQAVQALNELCEALKALHKVGIVHRDIKPSNIIVGKDGHIRLIDFDTARLMKAYQSRDTEHLGTIGYAPPEQYGFMQTDVRSDIYAFGMTMQELLGNAAKKPRYRHIIRKCTAFAPEKRYSDISLPCRAIKRSTSSAAVMVTISAAVVLVTAGILLLSSKNAPSEQVSHDSDTSEITDELSWGITDGAAGSRVDTYESVEHVQTTEHGVLTTTYENNGMVGPESEEAATYETSSTESVTEDIADIPVADMMTFETLQDENGRNYDSYEYVFYDDPELYGSWVLCGYAKGIPQGDLYFQGTLDGYSPKYITVLPDGELKTYNAGLRELGSFRWTKGYCIDESTEIHKVEQMYVHTNSDGTQIMIYERKPMGNGDDIMPLIYFLYKRIDG